MALSDTFYVFRKKGATGKKRDLCASVLRVNGEGLEDITDRLKFETDENVHVANVNVNIFGAAELLEEKENVKFTVRRKDGELTIRSKEYELEEITEEKAKEYAGDAESGKGSLALAFSMGYGRSYRSVVVGKGTAGLDPTITYV